MKKCQNCNRTYDDSKMFCPNCGTKLVLEQPSVPTPATNSNSASFMDQWGGLLLSALGLLIEWEFSVLIGVVIAGVGLMSGINSSNNINRIGSILIAVIAALLFLIWLL